MSGRATASIVELSGSRVPLSATAARTAFTDDADDARIAVDLDRLTVGDHLRCEAGADDGGDAVLAGDDRAVAEHAARVGHDGAGRREQRRPRRRRRLGDDDVAGLDAAGLADRADHARGPADDARRARRAAHLALVLRRLRDAVELHRETRERVVRRRRRRDRAEHRRRGQRALVGDRRQPLLDDRAQVGAGGLQRVLQLLGREHEHVVGDDDRAVLDQAAAALEEHGAQVVDRHVVDPEVVILGDHEAGLRRCEHRLELPGDLRRVVAQALARLRDRVLAGRCGGLGRDGRRLALGHAGEVLQALDDGRRVFGPARGDDRPLVGAAAVPVDVGLQVGDEGAARGGAVERRKDLGGGTRDEHVTHLGALDRAAAERPQRLADLDGHVRQALEQAVGVQRAGLGEQAAVELVELADREVGRQHDLEVQLPYAQQALPRLGDVRGEGLARRALEVEGVPEAEMLAHLGEDAPEPDLVERAERGAHGGLGQRALRRHLVGRAGHRHHRLVLVAVDRADLDAVDGGVVGAGAVAEAVAQRALDHRRLHRGERVGEVHLVLLPEQCLVGRSQSERGRVDRLGGHAASWARVVIGRH
jgi:hypothetical protein